MKNQTFGTEIEMVGITRLQAAKTIAKHFGTEHSVTHVGGAYDAYFAIDTQGRAWKCVTDSSLQADRTHQCEMVTPILTYADMNDLQAIVRDLRAAGAKSSAEYCCGIHVHIGALDYTVKEVRNLVNFMSANQDLIYKALQISPYRERYCAKLGKLDVDPFNAARPVDLEDCAKKWYKSENVNYHKSCHYDSSRYHGLNLHSLFSKGTVEFRLFNGTLHAGLIRAYVVFCLAVCDFAKKKSRLAPSKERKFNDRYTMYALLCEIGVKGKEFANCREHLTKHLVGGLGHEERYI